MSVILLGCFIQSYAQQEALYSQYMFNMMAINPAYAGSSEVLSASALFRKQWVGVKGAPLTQTITADMPYKEEKVGLGLQIYNDKYGLYSNTGIYATYAYKVKVTDETTLSMGITGGGTFFGVYLTESKLSTEYDEAFAQNRNGFLPNLGAGVYLSNEKGYLGFSSPMLLNNKYRTTLDTNRRSGQSRHYYFTSGYVFTLSESLKLKPSLLLKGTVGAPVTLDANLNLWINDILSVGTSWRTSNGAFRKSVYGNQFGDAVIAMVELQCNDQIRVGYAHDFAINGLRNGQSGSHEIMLRYDMNFNKKRIISPRYF
ncbi:MAG: type IX secretion system membrane protein PorP/SprF [Pseudarcicella sp.]|nr:type IX secretion system membrane protein PorP/SprF [Pseudarcicella sp.]